MAFASVGSLGIASSTSNDQSSLVLTTTAALEAGNLGVLLISVDNHNTTDADHSEISGVVDSEGNVWMKAAEYTNGQASAQAGVTCSVWYLVPTADLDLGATITISFNNSTSRDASAASAWEWTVTSQRAVAILTGASAADGANSIDSLDVATPDATYLRVRATAMESRNDIPIAPTTSWTAITGAEADDGTGTTSVIERGQDFIRRTRSGECVDLS